MPKTVETYRTTKALRDLVRRARLDPAFAPLSSNISRADSCPARPP